jgi:hypothetical protein
LVNSGCWSPLIHAYAQKCDSARSPATRAKLAARWQAEVAHYNSANLPFVNADERDQFFAHAEQALQALRSMP